METENFQGFLYIVIKFPQGSTFAKDVRMCCRFLGADPEPVKKKPGEPSWQNFGPSPPNVLLDGQQHLPVT